ncbi:MAG: hypothetical protein WC515_05530 [Candidatus Omnitrophota bacterium]
MRNVLLILIIVSCIASNSFASGMSSMEKGIIRLEYIGRQVQAIENELRLYYMAKIEDRPDVEPVDDVNQLIKLKQELSALDLPQEIADLKPDLLGVIDKLIDNCNGILKKDEKARDKEFDDFWKEVGAFNDKLKSKIDKYLSIPELGIDFSLANEETRLFTDSKDQTAFKQALSYIDKKKYQDAVKILEPLLSKYKNKPAEGSIIVRIADCYIVKDSPLSQRGGNEEYLIGLLIDFINRKQYTPQIQRIYLQWRTLEQSYNNGASNWSTMPNDHYNEVLLGVAEAIERHIDQHPDDYWAKYQLLLLMDTPIIERWGRGYQYGNTMALDYAFLNGMLNKE